MTATFKYAFFVLLLALQCVYWGLGTRPINKTQEIRVAETAREMNANRDWITPYFNGQIRLRKPPLAYWLTSASYALFDAATEFSARFASATFALFGAWLLFFRVRKATNERTALYTVLCLLSSYLALRFLRSAETDAILIFFVGAACFVAYEMLSKGYTRKRVLLLHLCMGLGFLAKGPAAIAIPLALLAAYAIRRKQYRPLPGLAHPAGLALLLVLAFGWYLIIYLQHPNAASYWVAEEVDATYLSGGAHTNPVYWYLGACFLFFAPWSLFIVPAAVWLYRMRPQEPMLRFALAWFLLTFVILSLNPAKQAQYTLLLNMPFAMLIGYYLANAEGVYARINKWIFVGLLFALAVAAAVYLTKQDFDPSTIFMLYAIALLPPAAAALCRFDWQSHLRPLLLAGLASAIWINGLKILYGPQSEGAAKAFALAAKAYAPLYAYGEANIPLSFYTERVVPVLSGAPEIAAALAKHDRIYIATDKMAAPGTEVLRAGKSTLRLVDIQTKE